MCKSSTFSDKYIQTYHFIAWMSLNIGSIFFGKDVRVCHIAWPQFFYSDAKWGNEREQKTQTTHVSIDWVVKPDSRDTGTHTHKSNVLAMKWWSMCSHFISAAMRTQCPNVFWSLSCFCITFVSHSLASTLTNCWLDFSVFNLSCECECVCVVLFTIPSAKYLEDKANYIKKLVDWQLWIEGDHRGEGRDVSINRAGGGHSKHTCLHSLRLLGSRILILDICACLLLATHWPIINSLTWRKIIFI